MLSFRYNKSENEFQESKLKYDILRSQKIDGKVSQLEKEMMVCDYNNEKKYNNYEENEEKYNRE